MTLTMFDHGALTDLVLGYLATAFESNVDITSGKEPPIGDGVAPAEGGWDAGQAGTGVFVPYVVLVSGGAVPVALDIANSVPAWGVGFSLRSFGGSRAQCDWIATQSRRALEGIKRSTFGDPVAKVINVQWVTLGPVARNDSTAPPSWGVFDTVTLVCDS